MTAMKTNTKEKTQKETSKSSEPGIEYGVLQKFQSGEISRNEAAIQLGCSERTITRKLKKLNTHGVEGLVHGNKNRTPINKKTDRLKEKYLSRYQEQYSNLNFSHALELIHQELDASERVSYTTFKNWCLDAGIQKARKRRTNKSPEPKKWSQHKVIMDMFLTPQEEVPNVS